jgi:hypothetical protein
LQNIFQYDIVLNLQWSRYTKEKQTINPIHTTPRSHPTEKKRLKNEKSKERESRAKKEKERERR